jgi:tetraacyldisaccharide 4'-kinase
MKTPRFWSCPYHPLALLLAPLGSVYAFVTSWRVRHARPYRAKVPVICIGNLTAGGTGKTPVSLAMADLLRQEGKNPFFLTRGYGGKIKNVLIDSDSKRRAEDVGDEPLLLAAHAPVVINPDRGQGARKAIQNGADCLIMDDGFQNPTLSKDVSFLIFDGAQGIGNGYAIPAGPLRERFPSGLARAQAAVILGEDKHHLAEKINLPVFYADVVELVPENNDSPVVAFAGIGRPQKFYDSLKKCGFQVIETYDFPDHHAYMRTELQTLIDRAAACGADLYTTSKDYVKIPTDMRKAFRVLEITVQWKDPKKLRDFLRTHGLIS